MLQNKKKYMSTWGNQPLNVTTQTTSIAMKLVSMATKLAFVVAKKDYVVAKHKISSNNGCIKLV